MPRSPNRRKSPVPNGQKRQRTAIETVLLSLYWPALFSTLVVAAKLIASDRLPRRDWSNELDWWRLAEFLALILLFRMLMTGFGLWISSRKVRRRKRP